MLITAALLAAYGGDRVCPVRPAPEAMLMIAPLVPRSRITRGCLQAGKPARIHGED